MPARRPHLPAFKTRQRCCTSISGLIYAVGGLNSSGEVLPCLPARSCLPPHWAAARLCLLCAHCDPPALTDSTPPSMLLLPVWRRSLASTFEYRRLFRTLEYFVGLWSMLSLARVLPHHVSTQLERFLSSCWGSSTNDRLHDILEVGLTGSTVLNLFLSGDSLNLVEVFDPVGNFWERCQPMRTARSRVGVAVVNGLLYAIGGYDGQSRLSTVEVYNPETDSWTRVSSMNSQRR